MTAATTTLTRPQATTRHLDDRLASAAALLVTALVALALIAIVIAGMSPSLPRADAAAPAPSARPTIQDRTAPAQFPAPAPLPQPGASLR